MDLLQRALDIADDRAVLVTGRETWTRGRLADSVAERVRELRGDVRPRGIRPVTLEPDARGIIDLLATWQMGGIPAPLSPKLSASERSKAVLALGAAERRRGGVPPATDVILWTSGTSGNPRGVAITERNLLASAAAVSRRLQLTQGDIWYASLSLSHIGGLALVVRALLLGSTLVAPGRFSVSGLKDALRGRGPAGAVTHVSLVPTQLARLLDEWGDTLAPPSLRCVLMGGAATPIPLLEQAQAAGWPISLTYGMTEMTSQVATATVSEVRERPGSVGKPLPGAEVRIADDAEILTKGSTQAAGFVGLDTPLTDAEGWYHSGDLGRMDDDGALWIVGRKSDRIVTGGVTVDPHEIEAALREHPAIRDVCVVGVPDPEWGERVAAMVVPSGSGLDQGRLYEWAYEELGTSRLPRSWLVKNHLPLNRNGKVDRKTVLALFEEMGTAEDGTNS